MFCCLIPPKQTDDSFLAIRTISIANMSTDDSIFHTTEHVEQVVKFATKALKCFDIIEPDETWNYGRSQFENVIICSAYMHDICHPANGSREIVEKIASECLGTRLKRSIDISNHIEDTKALKLESLHAIIGAHHTPDTFNFNSNQKQFMMSMIMATELNSYSDMERMNVVSPTLQDIGKVIIRCSDLGHFTLSWKSHLKWVRRLCNEMEFEMSATSQIEFIDKYVLPSFKLLNCFARNEKTSKWLSYIMANRILWEAMLDKND
jgi:hypothetical protein